LCDTALAAKAKNSQQVIVPRKGVLELQRVLNDEDVADVAIGSNHVRAQIAIAIGSGAADPNSHPALSRRAHISARTQSAGVGVE